MSGVAPASARPNMARGVIRESLMSRGVVSCSNYHRPVIGRLWAHRKSFMQAILGASKRRVIYPETLNSIINEKRSLPIVCELD